MEESVLAAWRLLIRICAKVPFDQYHIGTAVSTAPSLERRDDSEKLSFEVTLGELWRK